MQPSVMEMYIFAMLAAVLLGLSLARAVHVYGKDEMFCGDFLEQQYS